jgi:hypothetical protein
MVDSDDVVSDETALIFFEDRLSFVGVDFPFVLVIEG